MEVGTIILTHDSGFVPKGIRFFMKRYAKKLGVKVDKFYNHAACVVENDGDILVAEAMIKGTQVIYTPEEYLERHPDHLILTWVMPLTEAEQEAFSDVVIGACLRITKYDFKNFIDQIRMITFGAWKGKTGKDATKRLYCSELAALAMDSVRGSFDGRSWEVNPLMIQLSKDLKYE